MKEFKAVLKELYDSKEYRQWAEENKKAYLTHGFIMISDDVREEWQIGFYNPEHKKITTFTVNDKIYENPEADVFSDKKTVLKLDSKKVKVNTEKALETAEKVHKKKYSAYTTMKKIVIVQNLEIGHVWNITYITGSFKTLNFKIDSSTGKVLSDSLIDIFKVEK